LVACGAHRAYSLAQYQAAIRTDKISDDDDGGDDKRVNMTK
jgi:hypothetical protein